LDTPGLRVPIAYGLAYPERIAPSVDDVVDRRILHCSHPGCANRLIHVPA